MELFEHNDIKILKLHIFKLHFFQIFIIIIFLWGRGGGYLRAQALMQTRTEWEIRLE